MADMLRPDGKPFVTDNRSAIPVYVIEDDEQGRAVVMNQFTGAAEIIGPRPYSDDAMLAAYFSLRHKEGHTDG